jgi:DNA-binding transcriptional regulator YiaG
MIPPGYTVHADGTIIGLRGRPLKPWSDRKGYLYVSVRIEGRQRHKSVHQLVCEAFHGVCPTPQHEVRHLNGVPTDNRADNLKWGTRAENAADRIRHGTSQNPRFQGEDHPGAKLTWEQVREIRKRYTTGGVTQTALAAEYGVGATNLGHLLAGQTWPDPEYTPVMSKMHLRGEGHPEAKLTAPQIREIREKYAAGGVTQKELAQEYSVSRALLGLIIQRKRWAHL